jgi:hypothetical protein
MGGWDDGAAVQRKAQLRLLTSLPVLRLQDSAEGANSSGIAHHPVPKMQRSLRRDGRAETGQHLLSRGPSRSGTHWDAMRSKRALLKQVASFIETMDGLPVSKLLDVPE